jgi:hypothetical protein
VIAVADDGEYDTGRENCTVTLDPLAPGEHFAVWNAWNSSGKTHFECDLGIIAVAAAPAAADDPAFETGLAAGPATSGVVRFTLTALRETRPERGSTMCRGGSWPRGPSICRPRDGSIGRGTAELEVARSRPAAYISQRWRRAARG